MDRTKDATGQIGARLFRRGRDWALASASSLAIIFQPHIPLHLPGYRALMWLGLLLLIRLYSGRGWALGVGVVAAAGTLAVGRSPDGLWGVMQYAIAALLLELVLNARPSLARRAPGVAAVGAGALLLVGWLAPIGQGFSSGAGMSDLWFSLQSLGWSAWGRLLGFDLLFGAGAGLIACALYWAFARLERGAGASVRWEPVTN